MRLSQFAGKVLLIVNTASKCGFTPQFAGLEELYQRYRDRGLVILGFPCGQFLGQELSTGEDAASFCSLNYGVSFPMMKKVRVNGRYEDPTSPTSSALHAVHSPRALSGTSPSSSSHATVVGSSRFLSDD